MLQLAPGLLVTREVIDAGLAIDLDQIDVGIVGAFTGTGFENRVERAELPGFQIA